MAAEAANVTGRVRTVGIEHLFGSGRVDGKFGFTRFRGTNYSCVSESFFFLLGGG